MTLRAAHGSAPIIEALLSHPTKGSAARSLGFYDSRAMQKRLHRLGIRYRRVQGVWIFIRSPKLARSTLLGWRSEKAKSNRRRQIVARNGSQRPQSPIPDPNPPS